MLHNTLMAYLGLFASMWMVMGVIVAGIRYKGYSHSRQFLSELGATGSPTEKFSPAINNFPLGLLFVGFGFYVSQFDKSSTLIFFSGLLIVLHGLGTWIAGYFPMDADPYTKTPTFKSRIHALAGMIMFLSLLIAPVLLVFSPLFTWGFKLFSIACVFASIHFTLSFVRSYKVKKNLGTYQRLSYGAQLVWLSGLSLVLAAQ